MRRKACFAACYMVCVCSVAQNNESATLQGDTLQHVVVVSSAKQRDHTSTAPQFTISQQDFTSMGVTDVGDALHRLPGITLRDYGGAGGMKTASVRGFGAQHTGVVYDGVTLSDCQSGEIDLSRYSLDNVANLSLVVGDNDDIFVPARNAASAATLSISTLRMPTDDLDLHLTTSMRVGAWGYTNPYVRIDKNLTDRWGISAMGEYIYAENDYRFTTYNGSYTTVRNRTNSMMNSGHAELSSVFRPGRRSIISTKLYFYDNDRQLPGMVRYYVNTSAETQHDQNAFAQLNYRTWNGRNLSIALTGKFNYAMTDYKDGAYAGGIMDHQYWQREAYASACVLYRPSDRWAFDYSADYAFNNLTGSDMSTYSDPLRHTVLQSLTAKYSSGRFTAMARALYSIYLNDAKRGTSAKNVRHLSPSLSLNYKVLKDEDLFVRLSYKDIFRSPSFNELYYYHYGSPALNPEKTDQLNLGVTWNDNLAWGMEVRTSVDAYMNHVKDKIVAIPYNMFIWTNINCGKVETFGLDAVAELRKKIGRRHVLSFSGNYTFQKVQNRTNPDSPQYGYQLPYTPVHSGSVTLGWENPWANISLHGVMASSRWPNSEHYRGSKLKGYSDFGVTAYRDMRFGKHEFQVRLDATNIFDSHYELVALYPMPGIGWRASVKWKM